MATKSTNTTDREALRRQLEELSKADVSKFSEELEAHDEAHAHLYEERDALNDQINELMTRRAELADRITREHVQPQVEMRNRLAQAARDSGGRSLGQSTV